GNLRLVWRKRSRDRANSGDAEDAKYFELRKLETASILGFAARRPTLRKHCKGSRTQESSSVRTAVYRANANKQKRADVSWIASVSTKPTMKLLLRHERFVPGLFK